MIKPFLAYLCIAVCFLCTAPGCEGTDDSQPAGTSTGNYDAPGEGFNPYDQQPNQTAIDNQ